MYQKGMKAWFVQSYVLHCGYLPSCPACISVCNRQNGVGFQGYHLVNLCCWAQNFMLQKQLEVSIGVLFGGFWLFFFVPLKLGYN